MSTYESNIIPIDKLYNSIANWVDKEEYYAFFKRIFDKYTAIWQNDLRGNHWKNSLPRKLLQVHERILLTDAMYNGLTNESDNIIKHGYPSLIAYLRLTCFDQLGQPGNWMTFDNWIKAKKKKDERNQIVKKIQDDDKLIFAKNLYNEYQKIYGVKNSFFYFLREIIPNETRIKLFNKIKIQIDNVFTDEPFSRFNLREATDLDKETFLYRIRNDYTHNTYAEGPVFGFKASIGDSNWNTRGHFYNKKETHYIKTSIDFEDYLKEVILIGISEITKKK